MKTTATRTLIALSVFAAFGASATGTIFASSVQLKNGGNVETAIMQTAGQLSGLSGDVVKLQDRNAQQDKDIHDTYVLANSKYTEGAGKALEGEVRNNKADQAKTDATQNSRISTVETKQLDDHQAIANTRTQLNDQVVRQNGIDQQQNGLIQDAHAKADAGAVRMDGIEHQAGVLDNRVGAVEMRADKLEDGQRVQDKQIAVADSRSISNAVRLDGVEGGVRQTNTQLDADRAATQVRIEQEQSNRATQDRVITDRVRKEETARADADAGLSARIDTKVDTGTFNQRAAVVDGRFADTQQRIDINKADQARVNKAVAGTLTNHEQRIAGLEQQTNSRFANIDRRLDEIKDHASAGTAAAFAQANIPQVMAGGEFGIGAGAGTYSGQSAVAVGASYAPTDRLVLKATVSTDTQHNFGAGAGVMVSFR